jgi:hypothetical protein
MQSESRLFEFDIYSNVKTSMTLRNYMSGALVLYTRGIHRSTTNIFIKPGIMYATYVGLTLYVTYVGLTLYVTYVGLTLYVL